MLKEFLASTAAATKPRHLGIAAIALAVLFAAILELEHRSQYGHVAGYGLHTDILSQQEDLSIPGVRTVYCMVTRNLTVFPVDFEAIRLPGGYAGSGYFYHTRTQRWDQTSRSWTTLLDSVDLDKGTPWAAPNATDRLWPGYTMYPIGWTAIAATKGIRVGDTLRICVLRSFRPSAAAEVPDQVCSPAFAVRP